jgi:predicted dehydrogenase
MKYALIRLVAVLGLASLGSSHSAWAAEGGGRKLGVGLYGGNGHQLSAASLAKGAHARLVAVAQVRTAPPAGSGVKVYPDLGALLADPAVELVSLCSPRRADQARDAIRCLEAGRHVYAEKPCALSERELEEILAAARRAGREFHEMAGTVFVQPYLEMRRLVQAGAVGEVIQVLVQKSYPYGAHRPQEEALDGGMFLQVGIHAARMVEHAAGVRMRTIAGWETALGVPEEGEGKLAGAAQIGLENGGLATIIMNYLNPTNNKPRGHETLRIFGTKGFIESVDGGTRTRLVTAAGPVEPLDTSAGSRDYFDVIAAHLATGAALPLTSEEELHPLRMLLRAKAKIRPEPVPKSAAKLEIPKS